MQDRVGRRGHGPRAITREDALARLQHARNAAALLDAADDVIARNQITATCKARAEVAIARYFSLARDPEASSEDVEAAGQAAARSVAWLQYAVAHNNDAGYDLDRAVRLVVRDRDRRAGKWWAVRPQAARCTGTVVEPSRLPGRTPKPRTSRRRSRSAVASGQSDDDPPGEPPPGVLAGLADEIAFAFDPARLTLDGFQDAACELGLPMGHLHLAVFELLPEAHQDAATGALKAEMDARWTLEMERPS